MNAFSRKELTELAAFEAPLAITVFLPTHKAGVEVNEMQDALLFKSLLQDLRKNASAKGLSQELTEDVLAEGFRLLEDLDFWRSQQDGLAVFMAPGFLKAVRLPYPLKAELMTGKHFQVLPLFPMLDNKPFYLLVLSKHDATLYKGNFFGLKKMEVKGLPNGMDDVIHFEEKGGQQTFRRGGNKGEAAFHGQGAGLADEKTYIAHYLKEVDRTLQAEVLAVEKVPLLLSAVDYIASMYRKISHYNHIEDALLSGNFEHETPSELFARAQKALEGYFLRDQEAALHDFYEQSGGGLARTEPRNILTASREGKVGQLFVSRGAHIWGRLKGNGSKVDIRKEPVNGDECLLNQAAVQTFLNGGKVHLLPEDKMPEGSKLAALLRFE